MSGGRRRKPAGPPVRLRDVPAPQRRPEPAAVRRTRSGARAERTRRRRLLTAAAAILVAAVAAAGWVVMRPDGDDRQAPPSTGGEQQVVFLQVRGADDRGLVQALLSHDTADGGRGAMLLVQSGLVVDAAGTGSMPLGDVARVGAQTSSADALVDLLGVRVAGSWNLEIAGLQALVDSVGGVDVDVDVEVVRGGAVIVPEGNALLDGARAAAYATYRAEGESEAQRLARFKDVWAEFLRRLPAERAAAEAMVARTAEDAPSTLTSAELATLLVALRGDVERDEVTYQTLPVRSIETGSSVESYGIDEQQAKAVVAQLFERALLGRGNGQIRVLVQNGPRIPGLVESARAKLVDNGYRFVSGGNSADPQDESLVLLADQRPESRSRGLAVAELLGLPPESLKVAARGQSVADVIVVLGKDYKP